MNKNEILKAIEEKEREINELKEKLKVNTGWGTNKDNNYYCISSINIISHIYCGDNFDKLLLENQNMFSTKEKSEEIAFKQLLFRKFQKFADENNKCEIDWNDSEQLKYYIVYDSVKDEICTVYCCTCKTFGVVFFTEKETAQHAIDEFNSELKKYFGVEED